MNACELAYSTIINTAHHLMIYAGALIQNDLSVQYGKAVVEYVTEYMSCINKLYDKEDQPFKCTHWNDEHKRELRVICTNDNVDEYYIPIETYVCDICGSKFPYYAPKQTELERAIKFSCSYFDKSKKKYDKSYICSIIANYDKVKRIFSNKLEIIRHHNMTMDQIKIITMADQ